MLVDVRLGQPQLGSAAFGRKLMARVPLPAPSTSTPVVGQGLITWREIRNREAHAPFLKVG